MLKLLCREVTTTLGEKIKKIRVSNNLKQSELSEIFYVSEKTISSWENNRSVPDLNTIYKISDYFKKSFYYLINDEYDTGNVNEIEIKLKVNKNEYNRILNSNNSLENENGYKDVRRDFFTTAIKIGQPSAKQLVLSKHSQMK